jgi:hypothetical protein
MSDEIEPIAPEAARALLENAIRERLGDDWADEESGWTMITGHDYMARLTKGRVNLDFYVDLLGEVSVTESEINPAQDSAGLVIAMLIMVSLGIALIIAHTVAQWF